VRHAGPERSGRAAGQYAPAGLAEHREQDLDAAIAALWDEAHERALARVDVVEEAVAALLAGGLDRDLAERARREAHKLAGSLGTFGMPEGTDHARALERRLEEGAAPRDAPALADRVAALRGVVERGPARTPVTAAPVGPRDVALVGVPSPRVAAPRQGTQSSQTRSRSGMPSTRISSG